MPAARLIGYWRPDEVSRRPVERQEATALDDRATQKLVGSKPHQISELQPGATEYPEFRRAYEHGWPDLRVFVDPTSPRLVGPRFGGQATNPKVKVATIVARPSGERSQVMSAST